MAVVDKTKTAQMALGAPFFTAERKCSLVNDTTGVLSDWINVSFLAGLLGSFKIFMDLYNS